MAESARDAIEAFRRSHDEAARQVADSGPDQLRAGSGAAEWTVAQVLSHLGSSSETALDTLRARVANREGNQAVWDRWNAMAPAEQAANFVAWEERLVGALEALTDEELAGLRLDLGFLPWPVDVRHPRPPFRGPSGTQEPLGSDAEPWPTRDGNLPGPVRGSHAWGRRMSGPGGRVLLPL